MSTSRHWHRPCKPRLHQCWNTRRGCKGNPTHQHHAVSSADAPAARGGSRHIKAERLRTSEARSTPADQATATVPPVVAVCVPPSLLLFTMSIVAQVAAAGTGGRASSGSRVWASVVCVSARAARVHGRVRHRLGGNTAGSCEWPWPRLWPYSVIARVISVSSVGSAVLERRMNSEIAGQRREDAEHEGRTTPGRHSGGNNATEGGGRARRLSLSPGSAGGLSGARCACRRARIWIATRAGHGARECPGRRVAIRGACQRRRGHDVAGVAAQGARRGAHRQRVERCATSVGNCVGVVGSEIRVDGTRLLCNKHEEGRTREEWAKGARGGALRDVGGPSDGRCAGCAQSTHG